VSAEQARAFLERHGLAAHKDRGQNFLHDEGVARRLVALAGVRPEDGVLEIGTGLGMLTRALAERARSVETVEVDAGLVRALAEAGLPPNVRVHHADALELDLAAIVAGLGRPARIVANLPYSVATPLLRRFLDLRTAVEGVAVMVQREVAARIRARPGSRDYGSLSVLFHWGMTQGEAVDLPPSCFHPAPRVTSTFLCMSPRRDLLAAGELPALEGVLRAGFAHRRKTLVNSLARAADIDAVRTTAALRELGLDARVRAERLLPEQWLALARRLLARRNPEA
jgi:16S rRNA (adenine1518-N6/adenine1519-N6)-dimethyltransferase